MSHRHHENTFRSQWYCALHTQLYHSSHTICLSHLNSLSPNKDHKIISHGSMKCYLIILWGEHISFHNCFSRHNSSLFRLDTFLRFNFYPIFVKTKSFCFVKTNLMRLCREKGKCCWNHPFFMLWTLQKQKPCYNYRQNSICHRTNYLQNSSQLCTTGSARNYAFIGPS